MSSASMAHKRSAREAFSGSKGQLSAVAAAKLARQKIAEPVASQTAPDSSAQNLAAVIGEVEYDGHHEDSDPEPEEAGVVPLPTTSSCKPPVQLSSFQSEHKASALDSAHHLELDLSVNVTVTVVGEYDLLVLSGIVTAYGAVLRPESAKRRIYAPSTHALPQIQARQDGTKIRICKVKSSISKLEKLSPVFRNIWATADSSFAVLSSNEEDALQRSLRPLEVDRDMDVVLSTLNAKVNAESRKPRIMAVGAKSSGKSSFNRILCNRIQSWTPAARCQYLDLDPGQPEFGPPGQVSLVEVTTPLLGPPFTHFAEKDTPENRMMRSHTIAAMSFKHDPEHYKDCALDLIRHADTELPLIVNACGWVNGIGTSVLTDLASLLRITDIVLLEPFDPDFSELLQGVTSGVALHRISRQPPKLSPRTPAEQRAMQAMSYFHHRQQLGKSPKFGRKPLSEERPYVISYAGAQQAISAIISYGQAPKPEYLSEVLDGSVVAIVVLDFGHAAMLEGDIARTPDAIPYLLPNADGTTRTLDPKHSSCIGLALVRGIDTRDQSLHLVTPLSEDEMASLANKDVVLVRGSFDPPEWVYLEDLYYNDDGNVDMDDRPWVSKRQMVGIEGAVWRLRHPPLATSMAPSR